MRKTLLAGAALLFSTAAYADDPIHHITAQHVGTQCYAVQFDNDPQWYGVPLNLVASPSFGTANLVQANTMVTAHSTNHLVGFSVPGDYIKCKAAFGNDGMLPRITDIDED